jgi:hypothetical protein
MDASQTVKFFDIFKARHEESCDVDSLDVQFDRSNGSETRLTLTCPTCGRKVHGSIADADMPEVVAILKPGTIH